jgi:hypothetical protein
MQQRVLRASGLPATLVLLVAAAALFAVTRPKHLSATSVQAVAAAVVALGTLFGGAQLIARFFSWQTPRGAKALQELDTNPMDRIAGHFSWLVTHEDKPIAFFVDDIDRCPAEDVVELLETVQTLVRDAAEADPTAMSPCFVIAGDGAWIRNAFEQVYDDFSTEIAQPGRSLGYLFLGKIFQLTLPVPRVGPARQEVFFRELLGLGPAGETAAPEVVTAAQQAVEAAPNDDAQQQVLVNLPQAVREQVAPTAVRRQTESSFARATEHRLAGFSALLPDNPRAVKRFLNAFAMTRSVRTLEGQPIPTASLALWTILQTRWPRLADELVAHPDWLPDLDGANEMTQSVPWTEPDIPDEVRTLLADPAVQQVLTFDDGGPLTPDLVIACSGG